MAAGGTTVVAEHPVAIVGGLNAYRLVKSDVFTAQAPDLMISFAKGGIGDSTALIDDVRIFARHTLELGISLQYGNVPAIRIEGIPGRMVTLEYKESLTPETPWQTLTNFMLVTGSDLFSDNTAPISGSRFYRAQQ